jgi:menaquinol-cytochrome c reductase iron-sulfur subunit
MRESRPCNGCGAVTAAKPTRRLWLFKAGIVFNVIAGALFAIPVLGYALSTLFGKNPYRAWIVLGAVNDFPESNTRLATFRNPFVSAWDGATGDVPCWVRRLEGEKFQVFAINCTHLGCPVRWFQESRLFMCPCHGGVFYEDGGHASGPPPRGLFEYQHKVENGQLMINGGHLPNLSEPA